MLQQIHDKAKGWIAYAIVGFIAIPFTLFGIGSYLGGSNSLVAAVVNGEEIPVQQVQNDVLQQRQRLTQMFAGKLPPGFNDDAIKKQALEQIITRTLLRQSAVENGYRASNQEVYDYIADDPSFQKDGKFDAKTYELVLASQRRNKAGYERIVRNGLSVQQLPDTLTKTAFLPVDEIKRYAMLKNQTRDVETYTLKKDDFKAEVKVSDDEIKNYYEKNASRFMTLDKVKLSYIELKQDDLAEAVEVTDDALLAYYEENADRYVVAEQRKVAHILTKIDFKKDGKDAEKKAQEKADAIYKQIKDGTKTFEDLAKTDSDDKFSAKKGGEIGQIAKGDMGALFEKTAFSLSKDGISAPVKTESGIEIIKVLDVTESKQKTFEEVKDKVTSAYQKEQAEKLFMDQSDKLQTLAFENESSLDAAADAIGKQIETSDWITKGAIAVKQSLFTSPKLQAAAFSDDVLNAGKNSELLEINEGNVVVIRLQDHQPPKQKPLTDVSKDIAEILSNQKLRQLTTDKGEQVLKTLKETGAWSALVAVGGAEDKVEIQKGLKRSDAKFNRFILEKVFRMQKPEVGKKIFDGIVLPTGDYALIGLSLVTEGAAENDKDLQSRFSDMLAEREQEAMLKTMRKNAEVTLFLENIQ
ncbi:MAG TPA: hypothetical protein EYH20_04045 [Leucothrix sp.]|nr:hypothetical protein [Leucothrix sp.]